MEIVSYNIHPTIANICKHFKLQCFDLESHIFDDLQENHQYLQTLDPRDWKDQDHYAVLRLSKIRRLASQELIKIAYRKQLLNHHPDKGKRRLTKCVDENNDYFTCITRAFELLKEESTRNSYDSCDPEFDDNIPTAREAKSNFYEVFLPVFQRNSRWSKIQPVPSLGNENSPIEAVNRFYTFWDNFSSWREFSYADEETSSKDDNREQRRYIEKENRAERKRKLIAETKRINKLVDLSKLNDPRIIKFNADRKAAKEAEKKAKADQKLAVKLAAEQAIREEKERIEKEEADKKMKIQEEIANNRKQKEAAKNRHKNEKRKLRKLSESHDYYVEVLSKSSNNSNRSPALMKLEMVNVIDTLCLKLSVDEIATLNVALDTAATIEGKIQLIKTSELKVVGKNTEILKSYVTK